MNKKKLIRQCISCRKQLSREGFVRITKTYNLATGLDKVVINPNKHQFGRSVYVCKSESCIKLALKGEKKGKKIEKMLRVSTKSLEEITPELEKYVEVIA